MTLQRDELLGEENNHTVFAEHSENLSNERKINNES